MDCLNQSKQSRSHAIACLLFAFLPLSYVDAFELLSEGAMDSVSAVSANSAQDLLNIAGAPAAGLTIEGFESLPRSFDGQEGGAEVESLDSQLVREVESWADELRESLGSGFEVGYVESLPVSESVEESLESDLGSSGLGRNVSADDEEEAEDEGQNRIERVFIEESTRLVPGKPLFDRAFESAITQTTDPLDEGRTPGAGFVHDLDSTNGNRLTAIRDEDRPLF